MFKSRLLALFLVLSLFFITGCCGGKTLKKISPLKKPTQTAPVKGELKVTFIDVWQGDCILVQAPSGKTLLIDAGDKGKGKDVVVPYLQKIGVNKLDYIIATHAHSDHIGGMDEVIDSQIKVLNVIKSPLANNTKTYRAFLESVKQKGAKLTNSQPGQTLDLGPGVNAVILAPIKDYADNLNNSSVVLRVTFNNNVSFLFTGDAEREVEADMLGKYQSKELQAQVLKVGHHASRSSTSRAFLEKVKPQYAVIMCGKGNDYGHPHMPTLRELNACNVKILRTDELGNIIITTDGKEIKVTNEKSNIKPDSRPKDDGSYRSKKSYRKRSRKYDEDR